MPMPSWDDLRLFLAVTRAGRLTLARRAEGIDHTTVARRVAKLEGALGARLFDRSPRGVTLTEAGRTLRGHAEAMERAVEAASAAIGGRDVAVAGTVRVATPETFGTALVAPNVASFHARHPALTLELLPESRAVSLANREADVAIVLTPPSRGRLVTRRLTDYSLGLYASRAYLERCGPILTAGDLGRHAFAGYIDAMLDLPELAYLQELDDLPVPAFRSTSSAAQYATVASGLGIALLHDFVAQKDANLVLVLVT